MASSRNEAIFVFGELPDLMATVGVDWTAVLVWMIRP